MLIAFTLTACIDVDMTIDLNRQKAERVVVVGPDVEKMKSSPNANCELDGGTRTSTPDGGSACRSTATLSLNQWVKDGKASFIDTSNNKVDDFLPLSVKRINDNTLKLSFDTNTFIAMLAKGGIIPPDVPPEIRASLIDKLKEDAGSDSFKFRLNGSKVINSNGEIAGDGRSVTFSVPLIDVIDPDNKTCPDHYTAVVQVEETLAKVEKRSGYQGSLASRYVPEHLRKNQPAAQQTPSEADNAEDD